MGDEFIGYTLKQSLQIESKEVEKIESVSREITELLNKGVQFYSSPPRYYYTNLEDLKIELVSAATENARYRAEKIADNSVSELEDYLVSNIEYSRLSKLRDTAIVLIDWLDSFKSTLSDFNEVYCDNDLDNIRINLIISGLYCDYDNFMLEVINFYDNL